MYQMGTILESNETVKEAGSEVCEDWYKYMTSCCHLNY